MFKIFPSRKSILLLCSIAFCPFLLRSQVVINEGSNKNYSTLADEDGDYPDWIELYNAGSDSVDLFGYSLTDDYSVPAKWVMPHTNIPPGGYQIIYCSEKNRYASAPFTTVINTGTFVPTTGWNTHVFTSPFHWDGVSNISVDVCSYSSLGYITNSVFNQTSTSFNSTVVAFADGSPASCSYYSGTPVAQRPNMKLNDVVIGTGNIQNCNTCYPAPYGNWYWGARNQMLILASELTAAGLTQGNIDSLAFDVAYTDSVTYDYIEISMNLILDSSLNYLFLPSGGRNFHSNFKISGSGETIYLFSPDQEMLSSLHINCSSYDVSIGSSPDAAATSALFSPPTPAATNNESTPYNEYAEVPVMSESSGFFAVPISVTISNPNAGSSEVYYTLDGSDPGIFSNLYDGEAIEIYQSTVLRARAFVDGSLPSEIVNATYFFNVDHLTPILSVTTDYSNLYGPSGIFDYWDRDWLRPAYVEYFDSVADHPMIFSQNAGIMVDGGWGGSRYLPQHSFRVELANGVLGEGPVDYPLIPSRPERTKYSQFFLRNGSNQYLVLPHKDAAQVKMMSNGTKNYYSAWRPISVYINGQYFGLYELREKFDPEMFETLEGASQSSTEILSLSAWYGFVLRAVTGSVDSFWSAYASFSGLDPADTSFWNQADHYFDMEYYNDYIIAESWMGNADWPYNNIKIYRSDKTNERWRFCLIDLELALAPNNWTDCYFDAIGFLLGLGNGYPYTDIWYRGIGNDRFRNYFINRYADVMNTSYQLSNLSDVENGMFDQTVVEMANEYQRWGDPFNVPGQIDYFYNNHLTFQSELACRTEQVRSHIQNNFGLPQQVEVTLDVQPLGGGTIHISTITPDTYPWEGVYFDGLPIKVEAITNDGFQFSNWESNNLMTDLLNPVFNDTLTTDAALFRAYFEPVVTSNATSGNSEIGFKLFPSLAENTIAILNSSSLSEGKFSYQVVDLNGRILKEGPLNMDGMETTIDIHEWQPAMYFVKIKDETEILQHLRFTKIRLN